MNTRALSLEQAPPLWVPAGFFVVAPLAFAAAGALLLTHGGGLLATGWSPLTMALTHLGTLGLLGSVMLGALYQMVPVVAGTPVPAVRAALLVQALWVLGVGCLVGGLVLGQPWMMKTAMAALSLALVVFLLPTARALSLANHSPTVNGMRVALLGLAGVGVLGLALAAGHAGLLQVPQRAVTLRLHLTMGLVVWVGGLLSAVSWQVVPMFYLARPVPRWGQLSVLGGVTLSAVLPWGGLLMDSPTAVLLGAAPGLIAVFLLHPVLTLRSLHHRRRKRRDESLRGWQLGMICGLVTALLLPLAELGSDPRLPLAVAWLAIGGWAGLVVHGMLSRILPFLVWFHRYSALAGLQDVPSMKDLLPDRTVAVGVALHAGAVVLGASAIASGQDLLARAAGALLLACAAWVAAWMGRVLTG